MVNLPVIVGYGGVNAAGRSSFGHAYRRLVFEALDHAKQQRTLTSLAQLMRVDAADTHYAKIILEGTLIRKLEPELLDGKAVDFNHRLKAVGSLTHPTIFELQEKFLPKIIPDNWRVERLANDNIQISISDEQILLVPSQRELAVNSAGQLPSGFRPGSLYPSRNHPRGLQMTVYAASDALGSMGIDWQQIRARVPADQISVYAGSGMSQLDPNGNGGMMAARFNGKRVTSKQCPLGFAEMPADFVNAYILGSLGTTGTNMGACASFLYNLRQGVTDIQSGKSRVAIVGNSEAPIVPGIIEGYAAMGALATDKELTELGGGVLDHRRACRPFGTNCGFTLAESSQFVVLFDDELAIEMGAQIHGAVTDVFINADGFKKSISAPGVGNYVTMARALASGRALLGEDAVQNRSFVQAHGTGTPQNRVTESDVLNRAAQQFGINDWPVVAVKNYLGHSIGAAGADQLLATLGVWQDGILPGITCIDEVAEDVHQSHLDISNRHREIGADTADMAVINAKGFGGNNASAVVISPHTAESIVAAKNKGKSWSGYQQRAEKAKAKAVAYDEAMLADKAEPLYLYDHNVLSADELTFSPQSISIPGYAKAVDLNPDSPYKQWLDE